MIRLAFACAAALFCGVAVLRHAGQRGLFAGAAGAALGLALSGAAFSAGLLFLGATGAAADAVLLALAAALWAARPRAGKDSPQAPAPRALTVLVGAAALVVCALFLEHGIRYPEGGWDAMAIWNLRARALFGAPHDLRLVFTPELPAQHSDYPPLLPALVAHGFFALGSRTEAWPIAVSFVFGACCVAALGSAVSNRRGPTHGLAAALLLLGTPELLTLAWNQYADLKLAALVLIAVVLASEGHCLPAGLAAALGAYTKNEGLLWAAALSAAILAAQGRREALRFVAGGAPILLLLAYFKLRWAPPNDLVAQTSLLGALSRAPPRLPIVARGFALQLVDFGKWGCALPFVLACWLAGWRRRQRTLAAPFCALSLGAVFCIYLVTPQDAAEHMRSSMDRLLFQLWPALVYATFVAFAKAPSPTPPGTASRASPPPPGTR